MPVLLLWIGLCSQTGPLPSREPVGLAQHLDIAFSPLSKRLRLDVFHPEGQKGLPVVLFVHGGGWFTGDKDFFGVHRSVARSIARLGYVVVAPNYRLSPEVKHPTHVLDVARALKWTITHIEEHGGDPKRIALVGHSAGAHLASLLATDPGLWSAAPDLPSKEDFSRLVGVAGLGGVYIIPAGNQYLGMADRVGLAEQLAAVKGPDGKPFNPFKIAFGEEETICRKASPITHAREGLPPFLLMVAQRDLPGLEFMAREFADALKSKGCSSKVITVEGTNHVSLLREITQKEKPAAQEFSRFLEQVLARPMPGKPNLPPGERP